jgi:hypothetical protein
MNGVLFMGGIFQNMKRIMASMEVINGKPYYAKKALWTHI